MRISDWSSDVCSSDLAIELPPPLPPQAVPADELRTVANARTIEFKTYRVHLPANGGLDAAQVRRAIAGADTVDEAVSALAQAYYADGRLSDQLLRAEESRVGEECGSAC